MEFQRRKRFWIDAPLQLQMLGYVLILVTASLLPVASVGAASGSEPSRPASGEALPVGAAEPPPAAPSPYGPKLPAHWLSDTFGPEGLEALKERGYVVLQGHPDYRLERVHWQALEDLARRSRAALALAESYRRFSEGKPISSPGPPPFAELLELAPSGLMTPSLHTLATTLTAIHDDENELALSTAASQAPPQTLLFETPWGAGFAARTHADATLDPMGLVEPYFEAYLGGLKPQPQALAHFTHYLAERYKTDVAQVLAADARKGAPSEELRAWLRQYLIDQRLLVSVKRAKAALKSLEARTPFSRQLSDLERVARTLKDRPTLIAELKALTANVSAPAAGLKLSSIGLRLQEPSKLKEHEMGDAAALTGAYGVDGLPERKSAQVEETTFLEYPAGITGLRSALVRRANGWPYTFVRKVRITDSRSFTLVSLVSAAEGNAVSESLEIPVRPDFELALLGLAEAERLALSCNFKDAEGSYERLERVVSEAARAKPQYKDLLKSSRRGRAEAASNGAALSKLAELIAASQGDSSPEPCRYDAARTQKAIKLVKNLPAGCGKLLPDLDRRLAAIERRAADQETFARAAAQSRRLRESCDFAAAAELASRALAVLDADPPARCGASDEEAKKLEKEAAWARAGLLWRSEFESHLKAAQAEPAPEGRLKILVPLIARSSWLPWASCFSRERDAGGTLASAAGQSLPAPEPEAAARILPEDPELAKTEEEVALERRRLDAAFAALEARKAEEQAPAALPPEPPPPAPVTPPPPTDVPLAAPAGKTSPEAGRDGSLPLAAPKNRLQCLEEGLKSHSATIDCEEKPFDFAELKKLRTKIAKPEVKPRKKPRASAPKKKK